jgi:hypothetical protein
MFRTILAAILACATVWSAGAKAKTFDVIIPVDTALCGDPCGVSMGFPTVALQLGDSLNITVDLTPPLNSRGPNVGPFMIGMYADGGVQSGTAFETHGGQEKIQNAFWLSLSSSVASFSIDTSYYTIGPSSGPTVYADSINFDIGVAPELSTWIMVLIGFFTLGITKLSTLAVARQSATAT